MDKLKSQLTWLPATKAPENTVSAMRCDTPIAAELHAEREHEQHDE